MKKNRLIAFGLLIIILSIFFTSCTGNTESEETTLPKTEISTTQELPVNKYEVTTTEKTETTTEITAEENTEAPKPAPKPTEAPTKAPETTAKPAPKPTEKPKETKPAKDEVNDFDTGELPTTPSGAIDAGAMKDDIEDELGGIVYF